MTLLIIKAAIALPCLITLGRVVLKYRRFAARRKKPEKVHYGPWIEYTNNRKHGP